MKVQPITDEQAAEIAEWRYEFPYEWYDTSADPRRVELFADPADGRTCGRSSTTTASSSASSTSSPRDTRCGSGSACAPT